MSRPPFEVADIIRTHGKSFIEHNRSWLTWSAPEGADGHRALPHGGARRPPGPLRSLWL